MLVTSAGLLVFAAGACTVPDYTFVEDDATAPPPAVPDASKPVVVADTGEAGPADTGPPPEPYDGAPIMAFPIEIPNTGDFARDCAFTNITLSQREIITDPAGPTRRCTIFFYAQPWNRIWTEARDACTQITHAGKRGQLLTLLTKAKAEAVEVPFPDSMTAWVGLSLNAGGDPLNRTTWTWVTGAPLAYDGWGAGHPSGERCGNWANPASWGDLPCDKPKGFLCEVDE